MTETSVARIHVSYPRSKGEVRLRGDAPLSWEQDSAPIGSDGNWSTFEVPVAEGQRVEVKLIREDGRWAAGRNVVLVPGDVFELRPSFELEGGALSSWEELPVEDRAPLRYRVLVPPSYAERPDARYPVIYAHDGQSLWSDSVDPFGGWDLDEALAELWSLGSVRELIVVAIETADRRVDWLSPVPDPHCGGGAGEAYLRALVDRLKPHVDLTYRTRAEPASTAVMGSSLGGLHSFYAAWTRSDVFGTAICLSGSFWWADRWATRIAGEGQCPVPRPRMYIDSGAARSPLERDANARDGHSHTRALEVALVQHCYEPGKDLHVLTFPGHRHNAASWAARVAIPLQLMFPRSAE